MHQVVQAQHCLLLKSPDHIDAGEIIKGLKNKYGMIVAGGQDQAKGKIFRITHMGYVDKGDMISVIAGVENILQELKYDFTPGLVCVNCIKYIRFFIKY